MLNAPRNQAGKGAAGLVIRPIGRCSQRLTG